MTSIWFSLLASLLCICFVYPVSYLAAALSLELMTTACSSSTSSDCCCLLPLSAFPADGYAVMAVVIPPPYVSSFEVSAKESPVLELCLLVTCLV